MPFVTPAAARRARAYVRVQGPDAVDYLNRMLSNDVPAEGSVDALLLTAKARVIAPVLVWRRGDDDVLLLTEPELGDVLRTQLTRMRFAAKCEIEPEEHTSTIVFGEADGIPNRDYGVPATELLDAGLDAVGEEELEPLRIEAATPRLRSRDRRPRAAGRGRPRRSRGLVREGVLSRARSRSRGSATAARSTGACACSRSTAPSPSRRRRSCTARRRSAASRARCPGSRSPTSVSRCRTTRSCASGRQRRGYTDRSLAPVAQGIERCPAEAEVASSNLAGRTSLYGNRCRIRRACRRSRFVSCGTRHAPQRSCAEAERRPCGFLQAQSFSW